MSEDIEAKIRRLRELGKAGAPEQKEAPVAKPPAKPLPRPKPRRIGAIRSRERRKRILVGASIIIIAILLVSVGAYVYLQNQAQQRLENERANKLREVSSYFKGDLVNASQKCSEEPIRIKNELVQKINAANSVEELNKINVREYFNLALQKYNACVENQRRLEFEKQLNQTKEQKIKSIRMAFEPLLSLPLPDDLRQKAVNTLNTLEEQIWSAKSEEEVNATKPDPYLLTLWRDYYYYLIDSTPGEEVVLESEAEKNLISKAQAKAFISSLSDYRELMKYRVSQVEYVEIALVLTRDRINGAFLSPGDRVVIFSKNSTNAPFMEIVNRAYVEMVLLPSDAGRISVSESQSQTTSASSTSSTTYTEQSSESSSLGGGGISTQESSSDSYQNSQSTTQTASASYSYVVNLGEILKALAAGKMASPEEIQEQLEAYGWKVVDLEKDSGMLVLNPDTQFLVIIRVPTVFVPDILTYQQYLYLAKVAT